jgi:hypothetical protein
MKQDSPTVTILPGSVIAHWFYIPAGIVFSVFFIAPTLLAFYFQF